jgi:hypothetical protein
MLGGNATQIVEVGVARRDPVPGRGNADLRLCKIGVRLSEGAKHCTPRRPGRGRRGQGGYAGSDRAR